MLVTVNNIYCTVEGTTEELEWLYAFLAVKDPTADVRARAGLTVHDDHIRLFSIRSRRFLTGVLPLVRRQCAKLGKPLQVVDERNGPSTAPLPQSVVDWLSGEPWTLRDYHVEAMQQIAQPASPHQTPGRGLIWHSTGSGKGRLACAIAATFPGNWAFLVHRTHLARDIAQRWKDLTGDKAGWIASGSVEPRAKFTTATLQTLNARLVKPKKPDPRILKWVEKIDGIIVDEAHTSAARTTVKVLNKFGNAFYRLGLSGTPLDRSDRRSLVAVGCLGPVIHRIKTVDLIESGTLANPLVTYIPCTQRSSTKDWQEAYTSLVVRSEARNKILVDAMESNPMPGMVFVQRVEHGQILKKLAESRGLTVRFVSGDADQWQRQKACKDLERGKLDYIIATDVFTEGVNIPCLRSVVLAGGGKSVIRVLQQIGRVLRTYEGKAGAAVFDVSDYGCSFLRDHSKKRMAACQREGYDTIELPP